MQHSLISSSAVVGQCFEHEQRQLRAFSFRDVESHVLLNLPAIEAAGYERIVAIARGGLYAGTMLSQFTGLPLEVAWFDRSERKARSTCPPSQGGRLLLVEDIAGMGYTLTTVKDYLLDLGWQVDTFVLTWDNKSRSQPTYGMPLTTERPLFPWERGIALYSFSTERKGADPDFWKRGFDLDGVFLEDVPHELYTSNLAAALSQREAMPALAGRPCLWKNDGEAFIVSARLQSEQSQTEAWLQRHDLKARAVLLRENLTISAAQHKAQAILRHGITEFVESELEQAQDIARLVPHCVVWHYEHRTQALTRV